jgi:putative ABC transport system permease protein
VAGVAAGISGALRAFRAELKQSGVRGTAKLAVTRMKPLGVRLLFSVQMAGHGVSANPLRSGLTILGVAIGVASVVSLMGVGEGARRAVMQQFDSLGSNVIVIRAEHPSTRFLPEFADELVERVPTLVAATPVIEAQATMRWRRARGQVDLLGVNEMFPEIRDHALVSGQFFTKWHVELRSPVAVLGYNIGVGLMYGRSPVGQTLTIDGRSYRIVGVLAEKGAGRADDIDNKILIPYTTAQQIALSRTVTEIWGKASSAREADLAVVQLGRIIRRKLGLDLSAPSPGPTPVEPGRDTGGMDGPGVMPPVEPPGPPASTLLQTGQDLVTITSLNRLVKEADEANRVMTLLLGGIAAVSLLVGGLGIMNIMLVAVTERTGEIGVRRALGAKQADLLTQFLLEALFLSGIGLVAGVAAGVFGAGVFERYGLETAVSLQSIQVAAAVSLGTGLLFGVYPAMAASSVPPIEALRR